MKVAETKAKATPSKSNSSFFFKGAERSFFNDSGTERDFFFKKNNSNNFIQTKLRIGQSNDSYEKEADLTADKVVQKLRDNKSVHAVQNVPVGQTISSYVQRKCDSCEEEAKVQKKETQEHKEHDNISLHRKVEDDKVKGKEDETSIQTKAEERKPEERKLEEKEEKTVQRKCKDCEKDLENSSMNIEGSLSASKGTGRPMNGNVLKQMENSFGADFSNVRIHDNNMAAQMCNSLNAQAFAHGNDIYFNSGKYDPNSSSGIHLLAHELTHVIQQRGIKEKQVQLKGSHVNSIAATISIADPVISRKTEEEEDGFLISNAKEGLWAVLREASPEVYDILRYKGFMNWAKEKISKFVSNSINTLSAPIRLGAGVISLIRSNFEQFKLWLASAVERLKKGDCTPFSEATIFITNILEGIAGPVFEKIKEFLRPIKAFIDMVWNDIGKPIWEFVSRIFGNIWDGIKWVAEKVWNHIKLVISVYADIWHWFAKAIGFEGDDPDSFWEQIKRKVLSLWELIKQKLEPYKSKLMILAGIMLLLSPAGPFIIAGAAITGIMYLASKVRHYLNDREAIIRERGYVKGILIPSLFNAMHFLGNLLKAKANMILNSLRNALISLQSISQDLGDIALAALNAIVDWMTEKFEILNAWAEIQLMVLVSTMEIAFNRIKIFLQPLTSILSKVGLVLADYYKLPFLVLDILFHKIPKCIRDKIIAFLVKYVFKHIPILKEIKDVEGAWVKMQKQAFKIIEMVFVHGNLMGALWEIFNLLLDALKFPKELAIKVYNKAFEVFDSIIEKPKVFFINMLKTAKLGFTGFFERKWTHLKEGFTAWLFDAVKGAPVYIPRAFTFSEIFKLLGSLFNVGMEKVYKSIEKKRGKALASKVRKVLGYLSKGASAVWSWIKALHENSLDEIIVMLKSKGAELLQLLVDSVIDWIVSNIISKVSAKLVSMLDPTGVMAVVNSLVAFYNAVETAIEKAREILELVENVLDNVADVMAGAFTKAGLIFENGLQKAIPLFLEFLANQISMGKIGKKIKQMAEKAEKWIDEKIDWLVDKLLEAGDWLVDKGKKALKTVAGWLGFKEEFTVEDEVHSIYINGTEDNAELMVASEEMTMKVLFDLKSEEIENLNGENKSKKGKALNNAKTVYNKIKNIKDKIRKTEDSEKISSLENEMNKLFKEMIPFLIILGVSKSSSIPKTNVEFYGNNGKAGKVVADPLTKKQGNTKRSRPTVDPAGWKEHIMTIPNYSDYYGRLHLLNEYLHGPGDDLRNLTPGRRRENTTMEQQAETPAWYLILDNSVLWYESEITAYRKEEGFEYFAEGIRVSYGLKQKEKNGEWKRITQGSYSKVFNFTKPDEKGNREMIPTIDTMSGRHWDIFIETKSKAKGPTREVFRDLVNERSGMPDGKFGTWNKFLKSDAYKSAKKSSPGLELFFEDAFTQNKLKRL